MANYGFALSAVERKTEAREVATKLLGLAKREKDGTYWNLETNTPFFGWGRPGRIETTATVLKFLKSTEVEGGDEARNRALVFLFENKDRYGVWFSTQATVRVLQALVNSFNESTIGVQAKTIDIRVNGETIKSIASKNAFDNFNPVYVDLSEFTQSSESSIEILTGSKQPIQAQLVTTSYLPWSHVTKTTVNPSIDLKYDCDSYRSKPKKRITCKVKAERIGFRGYGMLLAEIGLPPGADVDRASLRKAVKDVSSLSHFEVMPDRIVFYMWAKAGGTSFEFKFKPRYRINAQTPASVVYDYYNEEARAVVKPKRFVVR